MPTLAANHCGGTSLACCFLLGFSRAEGAGCKGQELKGAGETAGLCQHTHADGQNIHTQRIKIYSSF